MAVKGEGVTTPRAIRLSEVDWALAKEMADIMGVTTPQVIRWAIRYYVLADDPQHGSAKWRKRMRNLYGHLSVGHGSIMVAEFARDCAEVRKEAREREKVREEGEPLAETVD